MGEIYQSVTLLHDKILYYKVSSLIPEKKHRIQHNTMNAFALFLFTKSIKIEF